MRDQKNALLLLLLFFACPANFSSPSVRDREAVPAALAEVAKYIMPLSKTPQPYICAFWVCIDVARLPLSAHSMYTEDEAEQEATKATPNNPYC